MPERTLTVRVVGGSDSVLDIQPMFGLNMDFNQDAAHLLQWMADRLPGGTFNAFMAMLGRENNIFLTNDEILDMLAARHAPPPEPVEEEWTEF